MFSEILIHCDLNSLPLTRFTIFTFIGKLGEIKEGNQTRNKNSSWEKNTNRSYGKENLQGMSTYYCSAQGFSLRPFILNSILRCVVLILIFFNILLACRIYTKLNFKTTSNGELTCFCCLVISYLWPERIIINIQVEF